MFWHLYKYRLKVLLKNRSLLFWTCAFPLLLGLLFSMTFGGLDDLDMLDTSQVGMVATNQQGQTLAEILTEMGSEEMPLFKVEELSEKEAAEKLAANRLTGYFVVKDGQVDLYIGQTGIPQTILQRVQSIYLQKQALIKSLITSGQTTPQELAQLGFSDASHVTVKNADTNFSIKSFYFFTLMGMTLLYGYMWGLKNTHDQQGNQSANGMRLDMSPLHKLLISSANLLAAFTIFSGIVLIVLGVFHYGYRVDFGDKWPQIFLLCGVSALTALAFGALIGNLMKNFSESQKNALGLTISMSMSFLAGMMGSQGIKYWIDQNLPLLGKINIINLISESLYQLFYYKSLTPFYQNLVWLLGFMVIFMGGNYLIERKAQYDSL